MKTRTNSIFLILWLFVLVLTTEAVAAPKWKEIEIPGICSLQMPPTMEIQSQEYKDDTVASANPDLLRIYSPNANLLTIQQKGLNKRDPKALKQYARVIFKISEVGARGDFPNKEFKDTFLSLSKNDLHEISENLKELTIEEMKPYVEKGLLGKIIKWDGFSIASVGGLSAMKLNYTREGLHGNSSVAATSYAIPMDYFMLNITLSYRINESKIWKDDIGRIISSIRFIP